MQRNEPLSHNLQASCAMHDLTGRHKRGTIKKTINFPVNNTTDALFLVVAWF